MTVITFRAPRVISAGNIVDEFRAVCETQLDAITTGLVEDTFTIRVGDSDVREVKNMARTNHFAVVSEEVE
jgi:hypothetical protein